MKGDTSRGEKLFRNISQGDKFKKEVEKIRADYKISDGGFAYKEYLYDWYGITMLPASKKRFDSFKEQIDVLLRRNALPLNSWWRRRVFTHALSGDKIDFLPPLHDFQQPFVELVDHHVSRDGSYNVLRIYERATNDDVREFISKHWKTTKPSYRVGTLQKIRKQKDEDIAINDEAAFLMSKSKKELGITGPFKEIAISKHLSKKHGKTLTPEATKARAYRTKRKRT